MVARDDLVLVDRNCRKSVLHSIIMTGAIPLYLCPERNELGIIGPIPLSEFSRESIQAKIDASPLTKGRTPKVKLAVVTNSTYDGLCYNAELIKQQLGNSVEVLHFDEAWYAYAAFHEFFSRALRHGHVSQCRQPAGVHHPFHAQAAGGIQPGVDDSCAGRWCPATGP